MAMTHSSAPSSRQPRKIRRDASRRPTFPDSGSGRPSTVGPRLLSRGDEIELATCIEEADREVLEVVAGSKVAVGELSTVLEAQDQGARKEEEASLEETDEPTHPATETEVLLGHARRLRALLSQRRAGNGAELEAARAELSEAALRHGLTPGTVGELLGRLVEVRRTCRASAEGTLDSTISAIRECHAKSKRARAAFVESNIGLVASMASRRAQGGLSLSDLIQEGTIGLMRAVDKFDHRRGFRFSTYAAWWIRHAMNRALSDQSRTIRLPVHLFETRQRVARLARDFRAESGREPTPAELSERAGVTEDKVLLLASLPAEPVSLETPIGADNDTRLGELIADPAGTSIVDELSLKHVRGRLEQLLGTLSTREEEILRLRFGTDGADPLTLQEIANSLSLSRERIRQIEVAALSKLRERAAAEDLGSHLAS
jgi:RNA polymerase primary sigma factor